MHHHEELTERARRLADEITAAVGGGCPAERIEAMLLSALREAVAGERERCAALAEERAGMWRRSRLADPSWPAEGRAEAQHRHREAIAIADAIRAGVPSPPPA